MPGSVNYDAIIVGSGMGGSAAAFILANRNLRILIIESGVSNQARNGAEKSPYLENFIDHSFCIDPSAFKKTGRSSCTMNSRLPIMGEGEGGSTAIYGAVLLRPHPKDLQTWPDNTYDDLNTYFQKAEEVFQPRGEHDPLSQDHDLPHPPYQATAEAIEIKKFFKNRGLHPYATPLGMSIGPDCEMCVSKLCPKKCKRSAISFLDLIRDLPNVEFKFKTTLKRINLSGGTISDIICGTDEGEKSFSAKFYFLAAGAVKTPIILMSNQTIDHPKGIGNQSDLVGRYLMRHLIDFYLVKAKTSKPVNESAKFAISFSDYYHQKTDWGIVNSANDLMPAEIMAKAFVYNLKQMCRLPLPYDFLARMIRFFLERLFRGKIVLCPIIQDSPVYENRIHPDSTSTDIKITYKIAKQDKNKVSDCRTALKNLFKNDKCKILKISHDPLFLAHACGTCRMARSPDQGVTDPSGKVFGIDNLYICDASLFPTSCGVNPSLTIAAVSMKLAEKFVENIWSKRKNV